MSDRYRLLEGDCLAVLPTLADASVDAVVCDPPYPEISRAYGRLTEAQWFALMRPVVGEVRRILKPTGSAVFVLQPNSEKVGRMRLWLWEFMVWVGREWGIVQDAYWWNISALPLTKNDPNLLRGSVKACVWCGLPDCYRDVGQVRWQESDWNRVRRLAGRCDNRLRQKPSGAGTRDQRAYSAAERVGGVTPFNLLPIGNDGSNGKYLHPARTPLLLCSWWVRYLCPSGGVVLDPFAGSGTVGIAALQHGCSFIGVERDPGYCAMARQRLEEAEAALAGQLVPVAEEVLS